MTTNTRPISNVPSQLLRAGIKPTLQDLVGCAHFVKTHTCGYGNILRQEAYPVISVTPDLNIGLGYVWCFYRNGVLETVQYSKNGRLAKATATNFSKFDELVRARFCVDCDWTPWNAKSLDDVALWEVAKDVTTTIQRGKHKGKELGAVLREDPEYIKQVTQYDGITIGLLLVPAGIKVWKPVYATEYNGGGIPVLTHLEVTAQGLAWLPKTEAALKSIGL